MNIQTGVLTEVIFDPMMYPR